MSEELPGGSAADVPAAEPADVTSNTAPPDVAPPDTPAPAGAAPDAAAPQAAASPLPSSPSSGLALAALVTGIASLVMASIPFVSFVAFIPAFAAIGLGVAALVKKARRGKPIAGIVLGALAFFVAIGVSAAAVSPGSSLRAPVADAGAGSPSASAPSSEPSAEPSVASPAPVIIPADKVYSGSGDSVLPIELPDGLDSAAVATISYSGERNFAVWSLDSNMEEDDLLVNEIGAYSGTVVFNLSGAGITSLEITASGPWSVTVRSILSLREFVAGSASGHGDDVLIYRGPAGVATLTHNGSRNFAVWKYGDRSDLVVNDIGAYSGSVRWTAGPSLVAVTADGDWSIAVANQ
ncbi:MAG: DUF4190 domain-containing protein [Cryobacterium sp.]|nr:DUF4190 domain-containing protein [Cryobacterium sp.]